MKVGELYMFSKGSDPGMHSAEGLIWLLAFDCVRTLAELYALCCTVCACLVASSASQDSNSAV